MSTAFRHLQLACLAYGVAANPSGSDVVAFVQHGLAAHHAGDRQAGIAKASYFPGCDSGTEDCTMEWDEDVNELSWPVHLPSGLKASDVVSLSGSMFFFIENGVGFVRALLQSVFPEKEKAMKMTQNCSLCSGNCNLRITGYGFEWDHISPTTMDNSTICESISNGSPVTHFELGNHIFNLPPPPPPFMDIHGSLGYHVSISRQGHGELFTQAMDLDLVPPGVSDVQKASGWKAWSPDSKEPARNLLQALPRIPSQALARVAGKLASDSVSLKEVYRKQSDPNLGKSSSAQVKQIAFRFMDVTFAGQVDYKANLSVTGEKCVIEQDGDTVCTFPFSSTNKVSLKWNSDAVLEQGSYTNIKIGPKLDGWGYGWVNKRMMQEFQVPACSHNHKTITISAFQQQIDIPLGKCGRWMNQLSVTDVDLIIPDIAKMNLRDFVPGQLKQFVPNSVEDMPPLSLHLEMHMYHKDNSHIRSIKVEVGLTS